MKSHLKNMIFDVYLKNIIVNQIDIYEAWLTFISKESQFETFSPLHIFTDHIKLH